jgi:hypothetical protein
MKIKIKKGDHYPKWWYRLQQFPWIAFNVSELTIRMKITESMFVFHTDPNCVSDSNKIMGAAPLFKSHHEESYRTSYVCYHAGHPRGLPNDKSIQFLWYQYVNGERTIVTLPGLYKKGDWAVTKYKLPRIIPIARKLGSYHGGNCRTPHDVDYTVHCSYR